MREIVAIVGSGKPYCYFVVLRTRIAALCAESRGYISPERSITSCVGAIRGSRSLKTIEQVAHSFRIQHCSCDSSIEQKKLGIKEPGKSSPSDFSCNPDRRDIDPEQRASDAIRERHWLKHLLKLDAWPVLFVCGCNHTASFLALLRANGIVVRVLFTNWGPNKRWNERRALGSI